MRCRWPKVEHPDFEVRQVDSRNLRVAWAEGFAQGSVEGVDGAVAVGDLHDALVPDVQLQLALGEEC